MQSSTYDHIAYEQKGTLKMFNLDAYYNKNAAANILGLHTMSALDNAYIVYDSRVADCFRLIYHNGKECQFQNFGDGLYTYVDPKDNWKIKTHEQKRPMNYLQTVDNVKKLMTKSEIDRAKYAVDVQEFFRVAVC